MTVTTLAAAIGGDLVVGTDPAASDRPVIDLTHDSRRVAAGWAFACVRGSQRDGHDHAGEALASGASCLLVDREIGAGADPAGVVIRVPDVRSSLGSASAVVHGNPSASLSTIGVTGTAGKTTVTHAIADVLSALGEPSSVLGTLDGARTTPEAPDLQRWLAQRLRAGDRHAAIEVSSHALTLGRVEATQFAVAVFTNLGAEHLDFHETMEEYFRAKARLFDGRAEVGVVNRDDPWGMRLVERTGGVRCVTYGWSDMQDAAVAADGSTFRWQGHVARTRLVGRFNLLNLAAAGRVASELGHRSPDIAEAMAQVRPVRGRMERVAVSGSDLHVLVDYSHKPDALLAALTAARELTEGHLWVVFGAGGDRDRAKRPLMGLAAAEAADSVVVTSDNPRSEEPMAIIDEVVGGIVDPHARSRVIVEGDRATAIGLAVSGAAPGDVVVVAGKGHEATQVIGDRVVDFDDAAIARRALEQRVRERGAAAR